MLAKKYKINIFYQGRQWKLLASQHILKIKTLI